MKERLQKILSSRGVASRRAAETMISAGRVTINGNTAQVGQSADPDTDTIRVDGALLPEGIHKIYVMVNKPRGYVTTMKDEQGRKNVTDLVSDVGARVYPVGRLDINSEGLLLMTNDGELTQLLTHPSNEKSKTYSVLVTGDVAQALKPLSESMDIDGYTIRPAEIQLLRQTPEGGILTITIHEGRNRQVRKMCIQVGLQVRSLKRIAEGGLSLGGLKTGQWRHLTNEEVSLLKTNNAGT